MNIEELYEQYSSFIIELGVQLLLALVIFVVGRWLAQGTKNFIVRRMTAKEIDQAVVQFTGSFVYALILIFTLVAVLSQLGVQTASMVAALGAMGLAVGLSLQGSLSNFDSGILIVLFKPCRVGDYVDAGGCSGTVSNISLLATTMLTPDNKTIIVPNSAIMSGSITNYSKMPTRRVDLVIGVAYDADLAKTKQVLEETVKSDERVLQEPAPTIAVSALADSSVNFNVRPWVNSSDYWPVYSALLENIKIALDKENIAIPFPQMDVHIQNDND